MFLGGVFYGTMVEWHRHRGVFPDFTMVKNFLHHGVFSKKSGGSKSPWWRDFELGVMAFDFGSETVSPNDEVVSKCCKGFTPPWWRFFVLGVEF